MNIILYGCNYLLKRIISCHVSKCSLLLPRFWGKGKNWLEQFLSYPFIQHCFCQMIPHARESRNISLTGDANRGENCPLVFILLSTRKPGSKTYSPWLLRVPDSAFYHQRLSDFLSRDHALNTVPLPFASPSFTCPMNYICNTLLNGWLLYR